MISSDWVEEFRTAIRRDVDRVFGVTADVAEGYDPLAADLHHALREFALRSTGLGAVFTLAVVRGRGGDWAGALPAATALDLLAAATLITDDVIDCDDVRWGAASLHARYREMARGRGWRDGERFGQSVGVIGAGVLTSLGYSTLAAAPLPEGARCQLLAILAEAQRRVDLSQLVDLRFEESFPSVDDWERMASNRAAAHIEASLRAGAALAHLAQTDVAHLVRAGRLLGLAYDVRADLLDTFGKATPRRVVGRDLAMRKKPLFLCAALAAPNTESRERLRQLITAPEVPVAEVKEIAARQGLVTAVDRLSEYAAGCCDALVRTSLSPQAKSFFLEMVARAARLGRLAARRSGT